MDPHISVVTAMLDSVAYRTGEFDAPVVPEADFVPFNLSYLSDFAESEKQSENPFGGHVENASDPLLA